MEIKITKLRCLRCGHEWFPRSEEMPDVCGKCKSPYWNKKIVFPSISKAQKKIRK
jgi:predicted Zn-ribbon and HTH transcriptional regulator